MNFIRYRYNLYLYNLYIRIKIVLVKWPFNEIKECHQWFAVLSLLASQKSFLDIYSLFSLFKWSTDLYKKFSTVLYKQCSTVLYKQWCTVLYKQCSTVCINNAEQICINSAVLICINSAIKFCITSTCTVLVILSTLQLIYAVQYSSIYPFCTYKLIIMLTV